MKFNLFWTVTRGVGLCGALSLGVFGKVGLAAGTDIRPAGLQPSIVRDAYFDDLRCEQSLLLNRHGQRSPAPDPLSIELNHLNREGRPRPLSFPSCKTPRALGHEVHLNIFEGDRPYHTIKVYVPESRTCGMPFEDLLAALRFGISRLPLSGIHVIDHLRLNPHADRYHSPTDAPVFATARQSTIDYFPDVFGILLQGDVIGVTRHEFAHALANYFWPFGIPAEYRAEALRDPREVNTEVVFHGIWGGRSYWAEDFAEAVRQYLNHLDEPETSTFMNEFPNRARFVQQMFAELELKDRENRTEARRRSIKRR